METLTAETVASFSDCCWRC